MQYYVATRTHSSVPTPHLDGKHVVFGKVRSNKALVRQIENIPTTSDKPNEPVQIAAAGVLSEEELAKEAEAKKAAQEGAAGEDIWEDFPADEENIDVDKPEEVIVVAQKLKELGTNEFKAGEHAVALEKYQKALRYLDQNPVLPDDAPKELVEGYRALRIPLLTNAALAALKVTPPANALAITLTTRALALPDLTPSERGKALYRRALGLSGKKDDEQAEKDLQAALQAVPGDAGITAALKNTQARIKAKKEKERQAYAKMFA